LTGVATVLIIGASRGIGFETLKAALEAGHSVRALARSARRIIVSHPKLEKIAGDALEMATVKRALTGIDAVIQSLGVSAGPEIIFEPTRLFSKATQVLVTAMEEARVKRLICVTGFGAGDSRGSGGFLYNVALHLLPSGLLGCFPAICRPTPTELDSGRSTGKRFGGSASLSSPPVGRCGSGRSLCSAIDLVGW